MEPVHGFTVENGDGFVVLALTNRYGAGDRYRFTVADALRIGEALLGMPVPGPA